MQSVPHQTKRIHLNILLYFAFMPLIKKLIATAVFFLSLLLISFSCFSQVPTVKATVYDSSLTTGYYFLTDGANLILLDRFGNVVYYKTGKQFSNFMLQPDGIMTYNVNPKFYMMDGTFKIVDSVWCKNFPITNYRDFRILANRHFL